MDSNLLALISREYVRYCTTWLYIHNVKPNACGSEVLVHVHVRHF